MINKEAPFIEMVRGVVKSYNKKKGYGFIVPDDGGLDVFVHATGLCDKIRVADKVCYDLEENKLGYVAKNVMVLR